MPNKGIPMAEWREKLKCEVIALEYSFVTHCARLYISPAQCCDMLACINLFQQMDPQVQRIETFTGLRKDATYIRESQNWIALMPNTNRNTT
jgi:hypothetical protein